MCNPVSLYAMRERADTMHSIELYDVFPRTISGVWQPFITVAALGSPLKGQVVLHEEQVGLLEACPSQKKKQMHTDKTIILLPQKSHLLVSHNPSLTG